MLLVKKNRLKKQFKNQLKKLLNIMYLTPYFVQIAISVVCSSKKNYEVIPILYASVASQILF